MSHTIEFTCQDCGADIVTSEDLDGLPVCVICRDTRRLEVETESCSAGHRLADWLHCGSSAWQW
jgi:hypothetical protein